jgi:hypothetical protein
MGSKRFRLGILATALLFGMVIIGCDLTDDNELNGIWGTYIVKGSKYSDFRLQINDGNWTAEKYNGNKYEPEAKGTANNGISTITHIHSNYWARTLPLYPEFSSVKYEDEFWYSKEEAEEKLFKGIDVVVINGEEVEKEVIISTFYNEFTYSVNNNKLRWGRVKYIRK